MAHDKSYAREKEAAQILNRVLAREPLHTGVAHYLIHGYDYRRWRSWALPAREELSTRSRPHRLTHSTCLHTFSRGWVFGKNRYDQTSMLGGGEAYAIRNRMPGRVGEQLHAMDYLAYAYLQGAQENMAWGVLDELKKIQESSRRISRWLMPSKLSPARYALERATMGWAAKLTLLQVLWERSPGALPVLRGHDLFRAAIEPRER